MNPLTSIAARERSKLVFENLGNTLVCAALAVAGLAIHKYRESSLLGEAAADWVALGLVWLATILVLWNLLLALGSLARQISVRSWTFWCMYLPLMCLYFFVTLSAFTAIVVQQARSFADAKATGATSVPVEPSVHR